MRYRFKECENWFPKTFAQSKEPILASIVLPRRVRTTKPSIENPPIIIGYIRDWIPRSRQLTSSLDEIEREAQESTRSTTRITLPDCTNQRSEEEQWQRSLIGAQRAQVEVNSLTWEFTVGRKDEPNAWYWDTWKYYFRNCQIRRRWAEILRSNLCWDWDTSRSLKRLFKIEKTVAPRGETKRAVLHASFAIKKESLVKEIQIPYETEAGEIRYRVFKASPSIESMKNVLSPNAQRKQRRMWRRLADETMVDIWRTAESERESEEEIS